MFYPHVWMSLLHHYSHRLQILLILYLLTEIFLLLLCYIIILIGYKFCEFFIYLLRSSSSSLSTVFYLHVWMSLLHHYSHKLQILLILYLLTEIFLLFFEYRCFISMFGCLCYIIILIGYKFFLFFIYLLRSSSSSTSTGVLSPCLDVFVTSLFS